MAVVSTDAAPDLAFANVSLVIMLEALEADTGFGNPVFFLLKCFRCKGFALLEVMSDFVVK